jgi:dipeptidyl aminopeptidase/acylaminoacyl peptidase
MNVWMWLILGGLLAFMLGLLAVWAFQTYDVYGFKEETVALETVGLEEAQIVEFTSEDGLAIPVWIYPPKPGEPVIVSFHGNFTSAGPAFARFKPLMEQGYGIAVMQYRGAPGTDGISSEVAFAQDARALYDGLDEVMGTQIAPQRRVLHGFSLGTGVAVTLASEREARLLILEASYARLCEYFSKRLRVVPMCALMWRERFDSLARISTIDMPVFFAHGAKDRALPLRMAERLFAEAVEPKSMTVYPQGGHSDLADHGVIEDMETAIEAAQ